MLLDLIDSARGGWLGKERKTDKQNKQSKQDKHFRSNKIMIIAATDKPESIDLGLSSPSRFD